MRIQNNIPAMNTHRVMGINNTNMSKSLEKLSSGYRINRAGDDAAGLAISEKMRAQIRGLTMASKNSSDAISLVQTAEGALQSTHDILQRMRELSVQSASDTNEQTIDRAALNQEFQALKAEINDIASKTAFNDQKLIDGTFSKNIVKFGASTDASGIGLGSGFETRVSATGKAYGEFDITVTGYDKVAAATTPGTAALLSATGTGLASATTALISAVTYSGPNTAAFNNNDYTFVVDDQGESQDGNFVIFKILDSSGKTVASSATIDLERWSLDSSNANSISFDGFGTFTLDMNDGGTVAELKSQLLGADINGQEFTIDDIGVDATVTSAKAAYASITLNGESQDVKLGDTSVTFRDSGITLYFDGGLRDTDLGTAGNLATLVSGTAVAVEAIAGQSLVIQTGANQGDELSINIDKMNATSLGIAGSHIATRDMASRAITEVNDALNQVSTQRAALGALQNRLEFKIANLDTSAENLQSAESRIRDVDMAKEMMNFTKNNILSQAATAMMAQANSLPQNVLQLLR